MYVIPIFITGALHHVTTTVKEKVTAYSTGPAETVWLLQFWLDQFSQGKNEIQFLQKQVINKSASVLFGLVGLIILSYNR